MILVIPLFDTLIKYAFILGISLYSYGISYMFILQNMFSILSILNTFVFVFTFFQNNYFSLLWDSFIYSILASNFCSFIIFIVTFGFLTICDLNNYIDNHDIIKIPLANMTTSKGVLLLYAFNMPLKLTYMTFQKLNGTYNITLNNEFENKINIRDYIQSFINKILYKKNNDLWSKLNSEEDILDEDWKKVISKNNKTEDPLDDIWKKVLSKKDQKEE
jgi:hypothetical protein